MATKPIPFTVPMVQAILAGRKSQTRRLLKPAPERTESGHWHVPWQVGGGSIMAPDATDRCLAVEAREGLRIQAGDLLWVREPWRASSAHDDLAPRDIPEGDAVEYLADAAKVLTGRYRHARFMPRWASRITLEVTGVKVERLQDITNADALAEGVEQSAPHFDPTLYRDYLLGGDCDTPRLSFETLWTSLHGPDEWNRNPFVVAYTFKTVRTAR